MLLFRVGVRVRVRVRVGGYRVVVF